MWSIGESNPCSAKNMVATPHCGARFLFFEAGTDEISATGGHQFLPLSNAFSAISKSGMRTLRARINKSGHPRRVSGLFVEHRGVEPLTSTMRMSRATNCANAPYLCCAVLSEWLVRKRQYNTAEGKKQGIFDGTGGFRYNPCSI